MLGKIERSLARVLIVEKAMGLELGMPILGLLEQENWGANFAHDKKVGCYLGIV